MTQRLLVLLALIALVGPPPAAAQTLPTGYHVETIASGLATPCAFDFLPDGRVLFAEQNTGRVRVLSAAGVLQTAPVLEVAGVVSGGERGLLGLAIDRLFPARNYLYVMHSAASPSRTRISRYTLTAGLTAGSADLVADPASRLDLLATIPDAAPNHNGGTLRFASDGTLIASIGDDAFPCGAQDSTGLRGVLLRMLVNRLGPQPGVAPIGIMTPVDNPYATSPDSNARLVLARGLRNPFRVQCDEALPWVIIGDVGENVREELDLLALPSVGTGPVTIAMHRAGANFGWPYLEGTATGTHASECGVAAPPGLAAPAYDYDRTQQNGASIIPVGFVTGLASSPRRVPGGLYVSDYYSGALVRLGAAANDWQPNSPLPGQPSPTHFGEGFREISDWRVRDGELWFLRQSSGFAANTGSIGRVVADSLPGPDPRPIGALTATLDRVPSVSTATIRFEGVFQFPARLSIHDASGRLRRTIDSFGLNSGGYFAYWDGLDDAGAQVPAGVYWAKLVSAGREVTVRVPFLR